MLSGVQSTAPLSSSSSPSHPSTVLSKSIVGGSTTVKSPPDETSTLFGVSRKNVAAEDDSIYVVKRDGSKEPLEGKKVSVYVVIVCSKLILLCGRT